MSPSLFFNNKKYISAKEASSLTGYSKDYIGQLARGNKIDSKRVGRIWYVEEESILNYRKFGGAPEPTFTPVEEIETKKVTTPEVPLSNVNQPLQTLKVEPKLPNHTKIVGSSLVLRKMLFLSLGFVSILGVFTLKSNDLGALLKNVASFAENFLPADSLKAVTPNQTQDNVADVLNNIYKKSTQVNSTSHTVTSDLSTSDLISSWTSYVSPKIVKTSITSKTPVIKKTVVSQISDATLLASLRRLLLTDLPSDIKLKLRGPAGPQGEPGQNGLQGPPGVTGYTFNTSPPPIPSNPGPVGVMGGFANLGVQDLNVKNLTVTNGSTLSGGITVTGDTNLKNSTVTGTLSVTGLTTLSGGLNVSGGLNPNLTSGSIFFQGASGLTEDNTNLFWDDTNNRLGIGTSTPGLTLDVVGTVGSSGSATFATGAGTTNTFGSGASSVNTIGSTTTPGVLTLHGATTLDNNFSQTGANTFSTGTGNVSLNGNTSITGANTFTVGTGLTTLNGDLTVNGSTVSIASTTLNLTGTSPVLDLTTASTLSINTVNNRPITTGTGLTTLGGNLTVSGTTISLASGTTIDESAGTLSVNTTNNRPVTFGTGTVTIPNLIVTNSQGNNGTMSIDSSATTQTIFAITGASLTSGTGISENLTANAGNGQVTHGQIMNLVDSTTAGGGFVGLGVTVTGSGTGSGAKYLLDLNPNTANNEVVFDNTGAFRPTTSVASNTATIGSPSFYWKNGYFDQITANNIAGTVITGATSSTTWTIGSTEAGDVNEAIVFQRNSGSGNALIQWNAGAGDLRYLSANYPVNTTYTVSDVSIGTGINLFSGALTNNTTAGTQKLLSLTNTGTGTTENGIYINNTGTGTTAFEIAGTWTNGIVTNNNSLNTGTGTITSGLINGQTISSTANFTGTVTVATSVSTPSLISTGALGITPAAGNNLNINLSTTGDFAVNTNQLYVDTSTGNVGIGTTIPGAKLELNGSSGTTNGLLLKRDASIYSNYYQDARWNENGYSIGSGGFDSIFMSSGDGDIIIGTPSAGASSATGSKLSVRGGVNIGYEANVAAPTNGLLVNGNVGIGITNPTSMLEVIGGTVGSLISATGNTTPLTLLGNTGNNNGFKIAFGSSGVNGKIGTGATVLTGMVLNDFGISAISKFYVGVNNGTTALAIDTSGNVGVGITNPNYPLQVNSSTAASYQQFTSTNSGTTSSDGMQIGIDSANNGLIGNYENGRLDFYTNGLATPKMSIGSTGLVGIGTTNPASKLQVYTSAATRTDVQIDSLVKANSSETGAIRFYGLDSVDTNQVYSGLTSAISSNTSTTEKGILNFEVTDAGSLNTRMSIVGSNVGIGSTNPATTLDVAGTINLSSNSQVSFGGTGQHSFVQGTSGGTLNLSSNSNNVTPEIQLVGNGGITLTGHGVNNDNVVINTSGVFSSGNLLNVKNNGTVMFLVRDTGNTAIGTNTANSRLDILATGTYGAAGVSGILQEAHTVTLSGANPTTYATFYGSQIGAMTLVGTNTNQTVTDAAGLTVSNPIKSTNVAITNSHGILVPVTGISTATNGYGLTVNAPTGATNNYAAEFLGGNVGIGTTAPATSLDITRAGVDANYGTLTLRDTTSATAGVGGVMSFTGYKTAQTNYGIFAKIGGFKENGSAADENGYLSFQTDTNGTVSEKMKITSAGQIVSQYTSTIHPQFTGPNAADTGISFSPNVNNVINFMINGGTRWQMDANGMLMTPTDNTYDIGASGATRPRTGYFGTSIVAPVATLAGSAPTLTLNNTTASDASNARTTTLDFFGTKADTTSINQGQIKVLHPSAANDGRGDMVFSVSNNAGTLTERFRILQDGQINVGTTTAIGQLNWKGPGGNAYSLVDSSTGLLQIGTTSTNDIQFQSNNGGTTIMTLLDSGNVGIGTTNPGSKLHLYATRAAQLTLLKLGTDSTGSATSDENSIDFTWQGGTYYMGRISGYGQSNAFGTGGLKFYTSGTSNAINATPSMTLDKDGNVGIGTTNPLNLLNLYGADGISYLRITDAVTGVTSTDGVRFGYNAGILRLQNYETGGFDIMNASGTTVRFLDNGNVGIGTTNPAYGSTTGTVLGLYSTSAGSTLSFLRDSDSIADTGVLGQLQFYAGNTVKTQVASIQGNAAGTSEDAGSLRFYTKASAGVLTERWRIDENGHLLANNDNTYDIGALGATRPRTGYFGTSIVNAVGSVSAPSYTFTGDTDTGIYQEGGGSLRFASDGSMAFRVSSANMTLGSGVNIVPTTTNNADIGASGTTWRTGHFGTSIVTPQVTFSGGSVLNGATSNVIEQRNGTNNQTAYIYNTYTDTSNYERIEFAATPTYSAIMTRSAGTGTARPMYVGPASSATLYFQTADTARWNIQPSTGHFFAQTDNTEDIGASGANRPRTGYFGTSIMDPLLIGGTATTSQLTLKTTTGVGADSNGISGTTGADIIFQTGNNGGTEALRIANSGKVQITAGSGSGRVGKPTGYLEIAIANNGSALGTNPNIALMNNGNVGTYNQIGFGYADALVASSVYPVVLGSQTTSSTAGTKGDFFIATRDTTTATDVPTTRFYISSAGLVGVGTNSPSGKLSVAGDMSGANLSTTGFQFNVASNTYTDTGIAGTRAFATANSFSGPTFASTNAVTLTDAATLYIASAPGAGSNTTITNKWSFYSASALNSTFAGNLSIGTTSPPSTRLNVIATSNNGITAVANFENPVAASAGYGMEIDLSASSVRQGTLVTAWEDAGSNAYLSFGTRTGGSLTQKWKINGSGHFLAETDNTYDIGASGATRPRSGFFGTSIVSPVGTFATSITTPYIDTTASGASKNIISLTSAGSKYGTIGVEGNTGTGAWSLGYSATANNTLGTNVLTWTGSGLVGIGTTNPGAPLQVDKATDGLVAIFGMGGATNPQLRLSGGQNFDIVNRATTGVDFEIADSPKMTILSGGNVGIGTTDPSVKLQVVGDEQIVGSVGGYTQWAEESNSATGEFPAGRRLSSISGDFTLFGARNTSSVSNGVILGYYDNTVATYRLGVRLNNANGFSNLQLMSSGGNVGIGSTAPTALFQAVQTTSGTGTVSNSASGTTVTGVNTQFLNTFKVGDTITANGETHTISAIASNTSLTTDAWTGANSAVAYTLAGGSRFSVLGNGNVGIGTTAPVSQLEVTGPGNSTTLGSNTAEWLTGSGGGLNRYTQLGLGYKGTNGVPPAVVAWQANSNNAYQGDMIFALRNADDYTAAPVQMMTIKPTGYVGIGTATPDTSLEINSAGTYGLMFSNSGIAHGVTSQVATDVGLSIGSSATNGGGDIMGISDNADAVALTLRGYIGSTNPTDTIPAVRITGGIKSGTNITSVGNSETLLQLDNAGNPTLTVLGSGNLGIGTTNPTSKLHLVGDMLQYPNLNGGISMYESDGGSLAFTVYSNANRGYLSLYNNGSELIRLNPDGGTAVSYFNAGNVGIGTNNPSIFKLQVTGSIGPTTDDTYDLGDDTHRFANLYLGPETLHIGTSTSDEGYISYTTSTNVLNMQSTGNLALQPTSGNVGIGTTNPGYALDINSSGTSTQNYEGFRILNRNSDGATITSSGLVLSATNSVGLIHTKIAAIEDTVDAANSDLAFYTGTGTGATPTEKMRILYNGNVGIGITSPAGKLSLQSSGTGDDIKYLTVHDFNGSDIWDLKYSNATGRLALDSSGSYPLTLNSTGGNVGIGTTNPGALLQIGSSAGTSNNTILVKADNTTGDPSIWFSVNGINDWSAGVDNSDSNKFKIGQDGPSSGTQYLTIDTSGNVGIATTAPNEKLEVDGNLYLNNGSSDTSIRFKNTASANTPSLTYRVADGRFGFVNTAGAENLTILNGGNVGIGSTNPGYKLEVAGTLGVTTGGSLFSQSTNGMLTALGIRNSNGGNAAAARMEFGNDSSAYSGTIAVFGSVHASKANVFQILNQQNANLELGGYGTSTMYIGNGNVGIGETNPGTRLTVVGVANTNTAYFQAANTSSQSFGPLIDAGTNSSDYSLFVRARDGTTFLKIRGDGIYFTGTAAGSPYNNTSGTSPNLVVASDGSLERFTSSLRFKTDFENLDITHVKNVLTALAPGGEAAGFTYRGIGGGDDKSTRYIGWGAETVFPIEPLLVSKDENGAPNGIMYDRMTVYLTAGWKDHQEKIEGLTLQLEDIENRVSALEANAGASGSGIEALGQYAVDFFTAGVQSVVDGVVYMKSLVVEKLTVGSTEKPSGIQMFDPNGVAYCVKVMVGGVLASEPGTCEPIPEPTPPPAEPTPAPTPTCTDGIQNQDETGIDTGGVCEVPPTPQALPTPTCTDGIQNQDETGIDTGGVCTPAPAPEPAP